MLIALIDEFAHQIRGRSFPRWSCGGWLRLNNRRTVESVLFRNKRRLTRCSERRTARHLRVGIHEVALKDSGHIHLFVGNGVGLSTRRADVRRSDNDELGFTAFKGFGACKCPDNGQISNTRNFVDGIAEVIFEKPSNGKTLTRSEFNRAFGSSDP